QTTTRCLDHGSESPDFNRMAPNSQTSDLHGFFRSEDAAVSLLVDQIGDVIEVDAENFETPPDTLQGTARELVQGAYKLDSRLLLLLNCEAAVELGKD
ncbi:MAG: chemotaxis protein CheW, partial [Pirellulaceae bacterium]|nr:chemotaxis protein CheW [Pirellulaceae bacterium]